MTFRYWNTDIDGWAVEGGNYEILVGSSSADIRLRGNLDVTEQGAPSPYDESLMPSYFSGKITNVPDSEYEKLLGRPIPDGS